MNVTRERIYLFTAEKKANKIFHLAAVTFSKVNIAAHQHRHIEVLIRFLCATNENNPNVLLLNRLKTVTVPVKDLRCSQGKNTTRRKQHISVSQTSNIVSFQDVLGDKTKQTNTGSPSQPHTWVEMRLGFFFKEQLSPT